MNKQTASINLWVLLPLGLYTAATVLALNGIDTGSLFASTVGVFGMLASYAAMSAGDRIYRARLAGWSGRGGRR